MNPMQKLILLFVAALVCGVMTACGPDLLELDPQEPSDLTVAQLVAKMNHATDPKGNYRDAKTYMMKQDLSSVKPGKKEYYATEIQFKAPDKMRTTTYRDGKAIAAVIFNGEQGWNVDLLKNRSEKLKPGLPLSLVRIFTQMATPGVNITKIFKHVTIDISYKDGTKTYRLICDPGVDGIAPDIIYVDGRTFLTKKLETIMYAVDGKEYLYSANTMSYVWIDDIRIARTSVVYSLNQTDISTLKEFKLNLDIPDSEFVPPVPFNHVVTDKK